MTEETAPLARAGDYIAPKLNRAAFHCVFCGVLAQQRWQRTYVVTAHNRIPTQVAHLRCGNCQNESYWYLDPTVPEEAGESDAGLMLWPIGSTNAPRPHIDMPADPVRDYEEARAIVDRSPRGAAALLRLAVQKLCIDLGESGENLNKDIASLVRKGLPVQVQRALDSLRVIGNNAVHPGQMDLRDDTDTAVALFGLLNFTVEQLIQRPKELDAIFESLPPSSRAQIQKRDEGGTSGGPQ